VLSPTLEAAGAGKVVSAGSSETGSGKPDKTCLQRSDSSTLSDRLEFMLLP